MSSDDHTAHGIQLTERMLGPQEAERTRQAWKRIRPHFERYVVQFLAGEI